MIEKQFFKNQQPSLLIFPKDKAPNYYNWIPETPSVLIFFVIRSLHEYDSKKKGEISYEISQENPVFLLTIGKDFISDSSIWWSPFIFK